MLSHHSDHMYIYIYMCSIYAFACILPLRLCRWSYNSRRPLRLCRWSYISRRPLRLSRWSYTFSRPLQSRWPLLRYPCNLPDFGIFWRVFSTRPCPRDFFMFFVSPRAATYHRSKKMTKVVSVAFVPKKTLYTPMFSCRFLKKICLLKSVYLYDLKVHLNHIYALIPLWLALFGFLFGLN
jgi:hypothetical protein